MNTEYQYGRKWNVHTPRIAIERYVSKLHVSVPYDELRKTIADKIAIARKSEPRWTAVIERQAIQLALMVHARNRGLYRAVVSGNLSGK